jgi:acetoacetyl-CoA reductase/3-oxoacyl-[acyl-carrier protein] reductase
MALARSGQLGHDSVGLTINTVAPGLVETDMIERIPEGVMERMRNQIPVRRIGRPEEIARVVTFLCSDASSYITGQVWSVNGGLDM